MPPCVCSFVLQGCVYFNGVYNARHWAGQAEHSERAGRALEASERWRSAEVHADSVIARHPQSHWTGEAYLIRGRAMVALESYSDAVVALQEARQRLVVTEQRREADLALGRANLGLRRVPQALEALDSAVLSRDARGRSLALLYRGRARLLAHRPGEALEDFRASREGDAPVEGARAALAAGDLALAAELAEVAASAKTFNEAQWAPLLDSIARAGQASRASALVERLALRADVGRGARARLVLGDALRLLRAADSVGAAARLHQVQRIAPDSVEGRAADVALARLDLAAAASTDDLARVRVRLQGMTSRGGQPATDASDLLRAISFADTLAVAPGVRDAFWFLRAEVLRDSLGATTLAATTFAQMAERFPDSPWTPKGLLAAIQAGHPGADSLRELLRERYSASPYTAIALVRDETPGTFAVLEDSLRQALFVLPAVGGEMNTVGPRLPVRAPATTVGTPQTSTPSRPGTRPIDP